MGDQDEKIVNVAKNVVLPFNPNKKSMLSGTATHIAFEVVISKLLRYVTKMENRSWTELVAIHALSQPFLGGFNFFKEATKIEKALENNKEVAATEKYPLMDQLKDGAKETPAVLVAMYIAATAQKGFAFPVFGIRDLMLVAAAKALSRVALTNVQDKLPPTLKDGVQVHETLMIRQKQESSIAKET